MARPIANTGTRPPAYPFSSLPISAHALSFSGIPGTGGTSISHYRVWLLDKPSGSSVSLSHTTSSTPTLFNLDTPGTVVLFVQVADERFNASLSPDPWTHPDNAAFVSEADPRLAPDSAFAFVSVKTEHLELEIPGNFERNWRSKFERFVRAADSTQGQLDAQLISDHDTAATGADLDLLTQGANASALHTHDHINTLAAVGVAGSIELASPPADPGHPKALTRHVLKITQSVKTADAIAIADLQEVFVFELPSSLDYGLFKLRKLNMLHCDGWDGVWHLHACPSWQFLSGTFGASLGTIDALSATSRQQQGMAFSPPLSVPADHLLVLTHETPRAVPASPTKHIVVSLELELQH